MYYILLLLLVFSFGGVSGRAQEVVSSETLAQVKKDSLIFERIVGEVLRQSFANPFAVSAEPRAAYLQGYGLVVSFQLKINRGTIRTFYGEIKNPLAREAVPTAKQLQMVREAMIQALADYGNTVKQLSEADRIAICAHVEDLNELDKNRNRMEMLFSVRKGDIELYATRKINLNEFRNKIQVVEY